MMTRRPLGSYATIVLVAVLLVATSVTLLHSHKDWTHQGCQLCHVRHLPSLHNGIVVAYAGPAVSQQNWSCEASANELDSCIRSTSSRSPPAAISFTV